ncbi:hypothetical protein M0R89_03530 [Halorussus limi]|uniref:Uncharacterized protein n=1 Tax=Halorussus limi TaxID=2938695 RepID=A0A8U0HWU6_9EURY|nr:hypothetical protein [Halorussus limi]UPV75146.1 hypothetical protein M0R89_03530 [Halorussus limi]
MPSRRALLRTFAAGTSLGVAGCLGSGGKSSGGTTPGPETGTTAETEPPNGTGTTDSAPPTVEAVEPAAVADRGVPRSPTIESDTYEPFRAFVVGERPDSPGNHYETPHVWVWNLTGDPATVEVTVATGGTELYRVETEFPAGAPLAVVFRERRTYDVTVREGDYEKTVTVEPDRFRCNATGTDVQVRLDGIEAGTVSTSMACTTTPGGT